MAHADSFMEYLMTLNAGVILIASLCVHLAACRSAEEAGRGSTQQGDDVDASLLSPPQRAMLIRQYDPINRVEMLLGEPLYTDKAGLMDLTGPVGQLTVHIRYYKLSHDVVIGVYYQIASEAAMYRFASARHNGYYSRSVQDEIERMKHNGRVAVQNGYSEWIVGLTRTVQRGLIGPHDLLAHYAFDAMDGPDEVLRVH